MDDVDVVDYDFFEPIVEQAARRIAYKMDAWDDLEDIAQEMWLACCEDSNLINSSSRNIHRRLGTVGVKLVLSQKNLGMVMEAEQSSQALSSPLDHELIEWALPQLQRQHRDVVRSVMVDGDVQVDKADLKEAFKALSEVVVIYEG